MSTASKGALRGVAIWEIVSWLATTLVGFVAGVSAPIGHPWSALAALALGGFVPVLNIQSSWRQARLGRSEDAKAQVARLLSRLDDLRERPGSKRLGSHSMPLNNEHTKKGRFPWQGTDKTLAVSIQ